MTHNGKMKIAKINIDGTGKSLINSDDSSDLDEDLDDELSRIQKQVDRLNNFKGEIVEKSDVYLNANDFVDENDVDQDIFKDSESKSKSVDNFSHDELMEQMRNEANIDCEEIIVEHEENSNEFPNYLKHSEDFGNSEDYIDMGIYEEVEIDQDSSEKEKEIKKIYIKKNKFKSNGDLVCQVSDKHSETIVNPVKYKNHKKTENKISDDEYLPEKSEGDAKKFIKSKRLLPKRKSHKRKLDSDDDDDEPGDADLQKIDKILHELVGDSDKDDEADDDDDEDEDADENDADGDEEIDDEDDCELDTDKKKKRKRIKTNSSSENDEEGSNEDDDDDDDENTASGKKRKKIRKIITQKKLSKETLDAAKAEEQRRKRIEERQKLFNQVTVEDSASPTKCLMTTKLVLECDEESKDAIIEVHKKVICKLKPHQVEAIKFMWNCCIESLDRLKSEEGSGCILAHCMGLGKTLSVISFVHTVLRHKNLTKLTTCLVLCPLNTILNWQSEFDRWLKGAQPLDVYEMSTVKDNYGRCQVIKEWRENGGVLILGYEMFRTLSQLTRIKNKKQKAIITEGLLDPGPDIVICDEGHILKNDATGLSKACSKFKSKRRVVLTGTPLQNNLIEYHCMVTFVKPSLLGTRKEFLNRFVNPITNGQCADSTPRDVKIMKNRAHVLHETLAGCVQRRDYTSLTKYLLPKYEYVISIRLSKVQVQLYEAYLKRVTSGEVPTAIRGSRIFSDYQNLMKIWTHPWILKLDEIRQEFRNTKKDSDSFIDDESDDDDSFIADDISDVSNQDSDDGNWRPKKRNRNNKIEVKKEKVKSKLKDSDAEEIFDNETSRPKANKRRGKIAESDEEKEDKAFESDDESQGGKVDKELEIIKSWKTRSRARKRGSDEFLNLEKASEIDKMSVLEPEINFSENQEGQAVSNEWWADYLKAEDEYALNISGKITLLAEILRMCESIGDKVLVFSQSLLSLDMIERFLSFWDKEILSNPDSQTAGAQGWDKGIDYIRMDGSTSAQNRKEWTALFNDENNQKARLFLISTRAGSLGINLVAANRVIIFDASWNPTHDIQSIFRVYRFGQTKPVYVYRFLAQGSMEEKIYERQVLKQSIAQRVIDEHQIERHFTAADLRELYVFKPDQLDDGNEKPTPKLPQDRMLAELLTEQKDWIVQYHEHDSLLENRTDEELTEEERKAAWEEYENEKKGIFKYQPPTNNFSSHMSSAAMYGQNMMQLPSMMDYNFMQANQIAQALLLQDPTLSPVELQNRIIQYMSYQTLQQQRAAYLYQQQQRQHQQREFEKMRLQMDAKRGINSSQRQRNHMSASKQLLNLVSRNNSNISEIIELDDDGPDTGLINNYSSNSNSTSSFRGGDISLGRSEKNRKMVRSRIADNLTTNSDSHNTYKKPSRSTNMSTFKLDDDNISEKTDGKSLDISSGLIANDTDVMVVETVDPKPEFSKSGNSDTKNLNGNSENLKSDNFDVAPESVENIN